MLDDIRLPPELRAAARRFSDLAAEAESRAIRLRQFQLPAIPPVDPARLAAEADKPSASAQLRAVAAAVRAGRTSWQEVAGGGANDLAEVRALREEAARTALAGLRAAVEERREERRQDQQPPRPATPDDEDFSDHNYLA
jgi:hypothetical protein